MPKAIKDIVILGGGAAGWISAGVLANKLSPSSTSNTITLIESKAVGTIGVGEGTWPTMRATLKKIGISENDLITQCDATFKQASKFVSWTNNSNQDFYYHPFNTPKAYPHINLAPYWQSEKWSQKSFSSTVSCQEAVCEHGLAPKTLNTAEYKDIANYGYHLDAKKFCALLKKHCTENLNVRYIQDDMKDVIKDNTGNIQSLLCYESGEIKGDFFVDCSGFNSLLLGKAMDVDFVDKSNQIFCDSALVLQKPYSDPDSPIPCYTQSTAQESGWIWDIGLSNRRGIGYVFSSHHTTDSIAEKTLNHYLGEQSEKLTPRKITFKTGHREIFWKKNCVAIGLAAGFIEPLEASALMFIETSAAMLADQFPANNNAIKNTAQRFNNAFIERWNGVIDFIKLHYVLSKRDEPFWVDNRDPNSMSTSLKNRLEAWQYEAPSDYDFPSQFDVFRAASYQYVLYGMGFHTDFSNSGHLYNEKSRADKVIAMKMKEQYNLCANLPQHRALINRIKQYGFSRI